MSVRVLVVDDHDVLSHSLVIALQGVGLSAAVAERWTPDELLIDVETQRPDVVLLDLHLGTDDTTLPLIPPLLALGCSVVVLTASAERTQLAEAIRLGASAALQKSAPFDRVVEAVQAAAEGRDAMSVRDREELLGDLRRTEMESLPLAARLSGLTARERAVLDQLVDGLTPVQIAEAQFVAVSTVRSQLKSIYRKLGVNSQLAAVALARRANRPRSI